MKRKYGEKEKFEQRQTKDKESNIKREKEKNIEREMETQNQVSEREKERD